MSTKKLYSEIDSSMLKSIPNPEKVKPYEVKIKQPEVTFLGVYNQPDFATLYILMYPNGRIVELKSLKLYIVKFRNLGIFHEHVTNKILEDFSKACKPHSISVKGDFNPRGGIKTTVSANN